MLLKGIIRHFDVWEDYLMSWSIIYIHYIFKARVKKLLVSSSACKLYKPCTSPSWSNVQGAVAFEAGVGVGGSADTLLLL